ncbi:MAG: rhamnogalacturonan acetylesterase [Bacteroidaceae bacterium]|nr:rhamnogalacturonan acetylesterase [Bacteroidaceae bacterium]
MKKLLSLLALSLSLTAAHAQHDIWIDINGVRDLTADSIDIANQVRPVPGSSRKGNNPVLFLVGNSTMRTGTLGNGSNGQWGWGFYAHEYYDENKITVENHALGGTSPRTFYNNLWKPVLAAIQKGDYVFLELGHNDNGPIDSIRARSSYRPNEVLEVKEDSISIYNKVTKKQETVYTFGGYTRRFINEIRAKGATPILFTLTPRNDYEEDNPKKIKRKLTDFTPAIFAIGKEMNVPVIDLNDISALKLEKYGPWKTDYHFYLDKIHSSAYGARMNAASAAEGILASNDPQLAVFKTYLNDKVIPKRCDQKRKPGKPVVFLCGDSTGKNEDKNPDGMWGWGSQGYTVFDSTKCVFQNQAKAGPSTRTYIDEDRWEEVYNSLEPGDVVLIQFGHNDIGGIKDGKERGVIACSKDSSKVYHMESSGIYKVIYSYGWYLKKMIRDAQEKGAIPVLLSLTPRNEWHEGKGVSKGFIYPVNEKKGKLYIERRNETYGVWCRDVARETGCEFVDVHNITANALDKMGKKKAAAYFNHDHTHTSLKGARLNAQSVAQGLREIGSPVAWLLKK